MPALLPRLARRRAGRADDDRRPPQGAAAAASSRRSCTASRSSAVACCYAGPVTEDGEQVVRPLKEFGAPVARRLRTEAVPRAPGDVRSELPASAVGTTSSPATSPELHGRGDRHHRRALAADRVTVHGVPDLADGRRGRACRRGRDRVQRPQRRLHVQHRRLYRDQPTASTRSGEWVRDFWSALEPHQQGVYVNFLGDEGGDRVRESYGAGEVRHGCRR